MAVTNAREVVVALGEHARDVEASVDARLSRLAEMGAGRMRALAPKFNSTLRKSIKVSMVAQCHYRIDVGVAYGPAVDEGRRPGKGLPHLDSPGALGVLTWLRGRRADHLRTFAGPVTKAMRRGMALNPKKGSPLANEREADLRDRYFAMSRSVKRKGIKAQPYFTPVADELERSTPQLLAETVQAAVARANSGVGAGAGARRAGGVA